MRIAETTISKKFLTVIPKAVRTALGLQPGDRIAWIVENARIYIEKVGECQRKG